MRVGTRRYRANPVRLAEDHPHACGDKGIRIVEGKKGKGSSPCVWGQEIGGASTAKCDRIIPMRVGTSAGTKKRAVRDGDHPHACGDKSCR